MEQYLDNLLQERRDKGYKGVYSSKSYLYDALLDWRVEKLWDSDYADVISYENKGFGFVTYTKRNPIHCTLRYIITLEEYRGQGVGTKVMEEIYKLMGKRDISTIRFFANKKSVEFYEKIGYKWWGNSKNGLPFTYTNIHTMELVEMGKRDFNKVQIQVI